MRGEGRSPSDRLKVEVDMHGDSGLSLVWKDMGQQQPKIFYFGKSDARYQGRSILGNVKNLLHLASNVCAKNGDQDSFFHNDGV
ncbi:hypothetical protein GDO81_020235 [Engystomops pustulosus]|uniref:Uncharacterized protein n=1 Tax=Engystomops pustulosus TaxID=76066 RepID=A0AAV6ZH25_ENGPU|nr:hypothetical protein GDO81_020235 [Engystomops pustulosus]